MSILLRYRGVTKQFIPAIIIFFTIFTVFPGISHGQPINEGFNAFTDGTRPAGWTFSGCNANSDTYTGAGDFGVAPPSIMLDADNDYIQTETLYHPSALTFWVKGIGTDASSALLVEEYYSGGGWSTLTNVTNLPDPGLDFGPYSMNFFATEARFTFHTGTMGNAAFDDVVISLAAPTPEITPTPSMTPTPTAYEPTLTPTPNSDIYNPSFELDPALTGWTVIATASTDRSSEQAYDGTYSCKFGNPTSTYSSRGVQCDEVWITAGIEYTFTGWFYLLNEGTGDPSDTVFKFEIEWFDSTHASVSSYTDEDWSVVAFDTWEEHSVVATAPPTAQYFKIYIACEEVNNTDNDAYIDLFSFTQPPKIDVTSPIAGDAWYVGDAENITWTSVGISTNIDIHYSTNGSDWAPIASNIADAGIYNWNPIPNDPSSQATVRVRETGGGGVSDESGQFTIAPANSINVLSPSGGETWYYGTVENIEWSVGTAVGPGTVDLEYSTNNGSSWISIATGVAVGSSPYPWPIPDEDSSLCLVRISQPSTLTFGQSPAVFTIGPPTFTVTSPSGGETWYQGDSETITWTYTAGISGNVDIDYSTNGIAGPWAEIASNRPNTGSFTPWPIPNDSSGNCRVRVSEVGGVGEPGISAADFTIVGAPVPQPYRKLGWELQGNLSEYGCTLYSIEAIDNDDIWVGSACSKIFYYDGVSWEERVQIGTNTRAIGATGTDDVWFGQAYGSAYNFNGMGFWNQDITIGKNINAVSAVDPDNIWMAADKYVFHTSGLFAGWDDYETESSGTIADMIFLRPYRGWILKGATETTNTRVLYSDDGSTWTIQTSFGKWGIGALTGCIDENGDPNLWVVGDCGYIFHSPDGVNWHHQTTIGVINWACAEALDQNNVWISGGGDIYHYNGNEWIFETSDVSTLIEISAVDNTHVYGISSSSTSKKVWWTYPLPTSTPTPWGMKTPSPTPIPSATPIGFKTPTPTPVSPICNNSFEEAPDLTCWIKYGTESSIEKSGAQHYDGSYSCLFEAPTTAYTGRGVYSAAIPIIGGEPYIFSGWYYVDFLAGAIADTQFQFEIWWYGGGSRISIVSNPGITLSAFNTWEKKTFNATAPAAADEVRIYISCKESSNNDNEAFIDLFNLDRPPGIAVTAPTTGAVWYVGESNNITWDSVSISGNIDIYYSVNNGANWTAVDTNIADTGVYPWNVPDNPSSQCLVRVQETGGGGASDTSGQFMIAAADTINVLAPKGGETWYQTGQYDIEWSVGPAVGGGTVDLYYSINSGPPWIPIDTGVALNSSPYSWTIPVENSTKCLVRVTQSSSGTSGVSPKVFKIKPPTFIVTSPAGGEYWYYGNSRPITWTSTQGITGNVNIDYSTGGPGGPWTQIAANQPNTGSYFSWLVPNVNSSTCRVRISEVGGSSAPGISAANFSVRGMSPPSAYRPLTWTVMNQIDCECSLYTIEAWDENNIWVGGSCGVVYFWDGATWELQAELGNIKTFKALAANDVYAGSTGGGIYHYDGSDWTRVWSSPKDIRSIDACDPNHILASSYENQKMYISTYNSGSGWLNYQLSDESARNVVYLRPDLAFVLVGSVSSTVYESNDTTDSASWTPMGYSGMGKNTNPFTGCLDQNFNPQLWVGGDCGYINYYDGNTGVWTNQTRVVVGKGWPNFECLEALDENNVWASGGGKVYHYNGSNWIIEDNDISTFYTISIVNNGLAYAIGSSGSKKIYIGRAVPTPTPFRPTTPTPYGYESPSPTPVPVPGPIAGRVYDRVTGDGIYNLYVRALPAVSGLMPNGARTDSNGYYTIPGLDAGLYYVYVDSNSGTGIREYRSQWYNQKDTQYTANSTGSNSSGIDFPLYEDGVYPTPVPTPTPDSQMIRVANGDYSGDGLSDIAIFRESSGLWAVRDVTRAYFGADGDIPVSGDYDGDGTADIALFRNSSGLWAVLDISRTYFGSSSDLPVPGDYDGDGICDIGIFRDISGLWAIKGITRNYFGGATDQAVSEDFDGDGRDDIGIFRGSSGLWALKDISRIYYGSSADSLVPGDYAGTGTAAPGIFRPSSGLWSIRNITRIYFGGGNGLPVPADFTGAADISIFRPSTGLWAIRGITRVYFGSSADLPVTK